MTAVQLQYVVKLRLRTLTWTSPTMTEATASELAAEVRVDVETLSASNGFVDFDCRGGKHVAVRARDVITVEYGPWVESPRTGTDTARRPVPGGCPGTGTEFLRQRAGIGQ